MACENLRAHVDAFVDGELEPSPHLEIERHVAVCDACRREVMATRALKKGLRSLAGTTHAPESLRERVRDALDEASGVTPWSDRVWAGGSLAAAAAMLVVFASGLWPARGVVPNTPSATRAPVAAEPVAFLPDVVERHTDPLPTESGTERPEDLSGWFRGKLGFRVGTVQFQEPDVRFIGARVSEVGHERAAKLYYRVGDSRVTMVAFEASPSVRRALARELEHGRHALIGGRDVVVPSVRGYTVPVFEHDGVVYAITGDLDQARLLDVLSSARLP